MIARAGLGSISGRSRPAEGKNPVGQKAPRGRVPRRTVGSISVNLGLSRVDLGSISGRSRVDLGSVSGRSQVDLGSISGRSRPAEGKNPVGGSISGQSRVDLGSISGRSRVDLGSISGHVCCVRLVLWYCWLFWAVARLLMSASDDTALRLVSAAVIAF